MKQANFNNAANVQEKTKTVVLPVAGLGTRLLPLTKSIPKHFQTVGEKPLIQYAVEEAQAAGIEHFIFVVNDDPMSISLLQKQFLEEIGGKSILKKEQVLFAVQSTPSGMWDAISCARPHIHDKSFAVICPDDLIIPANIGLAEIIEKQESHSQALIGVEKVDKQEVSKFGVLIPKKSGKGEGLTIEGIVEKPKPEEAPSNIVIAGRYILPIEIFEKFNPDAVSGKKVEVGLSHAIHAVCRNISVTAVEISGKRYDCGCKKGLALANVEAYLETYPELNKKMSPKQGGSLNRKK